MSDIERDEVDVPVDLVRLAAWMDDRDLGAGQGPLADIELIAGGTQNVLMRFRRGDRTYVLRRPPIHKRANSDETMRREARVLAALAGSAVPHPGLIAAEPDTDVLGASFYLMEPIDGFNATVEVPEPHRSDPAIQWQMGLSMADAIAELGSIEPAAVGLSDLGRAAGWLERQVPRWRKQLDSYLEVDGYDEIEVDGVDEVGEWLEAHRPKTMQAGLIHGDFHFANVLVAYDGPHLAAVVDWELATTGDPLLDLGHLLTTWPGALPSSKSVAISNLPDADTIIDRYADRSGRPLDDLAWFRVLACYRLGIILEGSHARARAGMTTDEIGDRLHSYTLDLFGLAHHLIST